MHESNFQLFYFLSIKLKSSLTVAALTESVLDLHAVAEYEFSFSVGDLFAGEQTNQLCLTLPSTFQLQSIQSFLQLYLLFVVKLRSLLIDKPEILVIEFLRDLWIVRRDHIGIIETFDRGYM